MSRILCGTCLSRALQAQVRLEIFSIKFLRKWSCHVQALAAASTEALEPRSADWVPLLLAYLGSRSPQTSDEAPTQAEDTPDALDAEGDEDIEEERRRSSASASHSGRAAGPARPPRTYVGARYTPYLTLQPSKHFILSREER